MKTTKEKMSETIDVIEDSFNALVDTYSIYDNIIYYQQVKEGIENLRIYLIELK